MDARNTKKLAACAAALWLALCPLVATAGKVRDGSTPSNGQPSDGEVGAGWDGATHRVFRVDQDGNLKITDETPYQLQNDAFIAASDTLGVAVTTGLKQLGLAWSVSPFGDRVLVIKRKTSGNFVDPCYLYLYGSDDNTSFRPLIGSNAWVGAGQAAADTAKVVPYRLILPAGTTGNNSWLFYRITLPSDIYPGRYLAIYGRRDSTVTSVTSQTLGITFEGRWK